MSGDPLWSALERRVAEQADSPAVIATAPDGVPVATVSWRAVARAAEGLDAQLHALGCGAGSRVALETSAPVAPLVALLACARGGRLLAPLHARWSAAARDAACAVLHPDVTLGLAPDAAFGADGDPGWALTPCARRSGPAFAPACLALPTSGTTGSPAWALLDAHALRAAATAAVEVLALKAGDAWIAAMPLYHIGGLSILTRGLFGGAVTVAQPRFAPAAIARWLDGAEAAPGVRVAGISVVPTMLHRLLDAGVAPGVLRAALVGGAACSPALVGRAVAAGWPLRLTYGLTEAASQVTTAPPGEAAAFPGSSGLPLPGTTVRIAEAGPGGIGEIVVAGPTLFRGYLGEEARSARALRGGELWTGDLGRIGPGGRLEVLDRRTDLIVSGGENVLPARVEAVLREVPGVRDAAVVGLPDPVWGHRVAAALELEAGQDGEAIVRAAGAHADARLARHEVPRVWRTTSALPRTDSGKVRRFAVRADW